jgi:excisionase family DNA binding protein
MAGSLGLEGQRMDTSLTTGSATPLLITSEEVARLMGISERTLWRLLSAGKVPVPLRFGRNTRWRRSEVLEWIEKGCPEAGK